MEETALQTANKQELRDLLFSIPEEMITEVLAQRTTIKLNNFMAKQIDINDQISKKFQDIETNVNEQSKKMFSIQQRASSQEYLGRKLLGQMLNPAVSAQRITTLLIYAGIWLKNKTAPILRFTEGTKPLVTKIKLMNTNGDGEYWEYKLHCERTWKIINEKLLEDGLFHNFYSCTTKDQIDSFIDGLVPERK